MYCSFFDKVPVPKFWDTCVIKEILKEAIAQMAKNRPISTPWLADGRTTRVAKRYILLAHYRYIEKTGFSKHRLIDCDLSWKSKLTYFQHYIGMYVML
jgi:hypothetical protein